MNLDDIMAKLTNDATYKEVYVNDPVCVGCGKTPEQLGEYVDAAKDAGLEPDEYVRQEEGTYNPRNGHFLCTSCYYDAGMPSVRGGWVAP